MRSVDIHLDRAGFGENLGEMRKWLDHNGCIPATFDTTTEGALRGWPNQRYGGYVGISGTLAGYCGIGAEAPSGKIKTCR